MGLYKILKIALLVLSVVGIIFCGIVIGKGDEVVKATGEGLDGFLYIAYIMLGLTILFVGIFVIRGLLAGDIKGTLMSIGAFLLIVVIAYVIADDTPLTLSSGDTLSSSGAKWVDTGLYTFYIMAFLAIASMVFTGIKKVTK